MDVVIRKVGWVAWALVAGACGGEVAQEPAPEPAVLLAHPPPEPGQALDAEGEGVDFAFTSLTFSVDDQAGDLDPNGWKTIGYDLDGRASTPTDVDLCRPYGDRSPKSVYPDGLMGIDNGFGKNTLPVFQGLVPDLRAVVSDAMAMGERSHILRVGGLADASDRRGLDVSLLLAAPSEAEDGAWAIADTALEDPTDVDTPRWSFADSYVTGGTLVTGRAGTLELRLPHAALDLRLRIHDAVITADVSSDRSALTDGVIAGVLVADELAEEFERVYGLVAPSLTQSCEGSTAEYLREGADMPVGADHDPNVTCGGISIGVRFEAVAIPRPDEVVEVPVEDYPCEP